jgi:hypothetical protein
MAEILDLKPAELENQLDLVDHPFNKIDKKSVSPALPGSDLFLQPIKHAAMGSAGLQCGPAVCARARRWRDKQHW